MCCCRPARCAGGSIEGLPIHPQPPSHSSTTFTENPSQGSSISALQLACSHPHCHRQPTPHSPPHPPTRIQRSVHPQFPPPSLHHPTPSPKHKSADHPTTPAPDIPTPSPSAKYLHDTTWRHDRKSQTSRSQPHSNACGGGSTREGNRNKLHPTRSAPSSIPFPSSDSSDIPAHLPL